MAEDLSLPQISRKAAESNSLVTVKGDKKETSTRWLSNTTICICRTVSWSLLLLSAQASKHWSCRHLCSHPRSAISQLEQAVCLSSLAFTFCKIRGNWPKRHKPTIFTNQNSTNENYVKFEMHKYMSLCVCMYVYMHKTQNSWYLVAGW